MTYRFEEYSPEYKAQIAALRSRTWGGDLAFSIDYFEWKYEQNPYLTEPHFYVALHEEAVVGMRGFYGSRWQAGQESESWLIPIGGDLAVDLDHRRHKVAARMLAFITEDMARKGYAYLMNLSANTSSRRLQIQSKYPRVAPFRTFQRGKPRTTLLARGYRRIQRTLLARGYRRIQRTLIRHRSVVPFRRFDNWAANSRGPIIGASAPRISEMGELVLRCGDKSRIHLVRDAAFYQWRFMNPACDYRFIFFEDSRSLEGFLVLQSPKAGGWTTIIDWEASTPAIWTELVAAAIKSNAKQLKITSTAFTDGQIQSLQSLGFEPLVEPDSTDNPAPGMLLHISSDHDADDPDVGGLRVLDANSWDIRMIASDAY
jgi:GNAT superfamily N-acetyltransferase